MGEVFITRRGGAGGLIRLPEFDYTGEYTVIDDGERNWRIKFLTSGVFTLQKDVTADVFLVGGGGGGFWQSSVGRRGGGGGGGYTLTQKGAVLSKGHSYSIDIGAGGAVNADGGTTTAFGFMANGGKAGKRYNSNPSGGEGGSGGGNGANYAGAGDNTGGVGGEDGGDGHHAIGTNVGNYTVAKGQGSTTREFGEESGELYAGGGGGGGQRGGAGGAGGGGRGASNAEGEHAYAGKPNTGGGGGGASGDSEATTQAAAGGSGIVIIRNAR